VSITGILPVDKAEPARAAGILSRRVAWRIGKSATRM
jgi:hypothetical protein